MIEITPLSVCNSKKKKNQGVKPGFMIQNSVLCTLPHLCFQVLFCFLLFMCLFCVVDGDSSAFEIRL